MNVLGAQVNRRLDTLKLPLRIRIAANVTLGAAFVLLCIEELERRSKSVETQQMQIMAEMGKDNLKGGIEYYGKMLERGKILREVVQYGEYFFKETGDLEPYWFRAHEADESSKLGALKAALEEIENNER